MVRLYVLSLQVIMKGHVKFLHKKFPKSILPKTHELTHKKLRKSPNSY